MRRPLTRTTAVLALALTATFALSACSPFGGAAPAPTPTVALPTGTSGAADFDAFSLVVGNGSTPVSVYLDPACPHCASLEDAAGETLAELATTGDIRYSIHPLTFMDRNSDSMYSSRAASAMTCVAVEASSSLTDFVAAVFENQSSQLDDAGLAELADGVGASAAADCIADQTYVAWAQAGTAAALTGPIADAEIEKVQGTPTILVSGRPYEGDITDVDEIRDFIASDGR
ncbi:DsbA family protein [Agromyces atrinae]|uniref:Protein-disulfide isomerase n=1 Tax=Agromyces atrinae TaxID=592376 RepID=A0A4Q2MAZ6_9MICO|nr:thioredoxin domain-containing protein [Agromyces atrinae]NYD65900.1 protein-disulfide isomerase [Agromyces atrinae]RXZ86240.1 hypothetical protein ESP50_10785 [Agromyces atrinae]